MNQMKFGLYFKFLLKPMTSQISWLPVSYSINDFDWRLKFKTVPVIKNIWRYLFVNAENTAGTYIEKLSSPLSKTQVYFLKKDQFYPNHSW